MPGTIGRRLRAAVRGEIDRERPYRVVVTLPERTAPRRREGWTTYAGRVTRALSGMRRVLGGPRHDVLVLGNAISVMLSGEQLREFTTLLGRRENHTLFGRA